MGRDYLDKIGSRASQADPTYRHSKQQLDAFARLSERREAREIEDLKATIAQLEADLESVAKYREEKQEESVKESESRKAVEKEISSLKKQVERAQEEAKTHSTAHNELSKEVKILRIQIESDSRVIQLKEEIKTYETQATQLRVELKKLEEESETFQTRCKQLEEEATNVGGSKKGDKAKEARLEREIEEMEEKIESLAKEKTELTTILKTTKKRVETLEKQVRDLELKITRLESDNARLVEQVESPFKPVPGIVSAEEKKLLRENTTLKDTIESLEKRCAVLSKKNDNGGNSSSSSAGTPERYAILLDNLSLSEDDVSLLLTSGPFWPPIRATYPDSSIIDHLWMLNDQEGEFKQEKLDWLEEKADLERQIHRLKEAAANAANEGGAEKYRKTVRDVERRERELERIKGDYEDKKKEWEEETEEKVKTIEFMEQKISELEKQIESKNLEISSTALAVVPNEVPAPSGAAFDTAMKNIAESNKELEELREENTNLLLHLAGTA